MMDGEIVRVELPEKLRSQFHCFPYESGCFDFDLTERQSSNHRHQPLLRSISEENKSSREGYHLNCACLPNKPELLVKRRDKNFYIALKARTGLQHALSCPFRAQPITTYSVKAIRPDSDKTVSISLGFPLGANTSKSRQPVSDEHVLRFRKRPDVQFNSLGPAGLLRLLFHEAGLNFWCPAFVREEHRSTVKSDGSMDWKHSRNKISRALARIFWNKQPIAQHCRIVKLLNDLTPKFIYFVIDGIHEILPREPSGWLIKICRLPYTDLELSEETLHKVLAQVGYKTNTITRLLSARERITPRQGEYWWAGLVVEFTIDGRYDIQQAAVLRTDFRAIPIESEPEFRMIEHLIERGRSFTKPLFPGCLEKLPERRPDFLLADSAIHEFCIEVAGMGDFEEYKTRDEIRRAEYDSAGIKYAVWTPPADFPILPDVAGT